MPPFAGKVEGKFRKGNRKEKRMNTEERTEEIVGIGLKGLRLLSYNEIVDLMYCGSVTEDEVVAALARTIVFSEAHCVQLKGWLAVLLPEWYRALRGVGEYGLIPLCEAGTKRVGGMALRGDLWLGEDKTWWINFCGAGETKVLGLLTLQTWSEAQTRGACNVCLTSRKEKE